uniref:CSON012400 protein n=1 Tax=Culicoides sonorensis TaxID=179676 RepID=A0A336M7Z0_CULSO
MSYNLTLQQQQQKNIACAFLGQNIKTAIAILNCILARQLCFEDPSCSAILEIIPRVCGPVPVACSTVTVTKCQAALRTLQAFPFFRPTCLCKEPGADPDCNYFRDFLFDHPCGFVLKKEKDPYPVDALPTCNHALSVCQQERKCIKLFEDFKLHCKVRDNKCKMEDKNLCHEAWTNLRMSPMFGCICPNNHMKKRCDKIFSVVNHNPCVDLLPSTLDENSGTATNSVYPLFPSDIEEAPPKKYPYTFPYFLYPPKKIPYALASHRPSYDATIYAYNISSHYAEFDEMSTINNYNYNEHEHLHKHNLHQYTPISSNNYENKEHHSTASNKNNLHHQHSHIKFNTNKHEYEGNDTSTSSTSNFKYPFDHEWRREQYKIQRAKIVGGYDDIDDPDKDIVDIINFQSTCQIALDACRRDSMCYSTLQPMLMHCDVDRCNRQVCMETIQTFYRTAHVNLTSDVAFCLCRKTDNRHDTCKLAQEKLHPNCAERPDEDTSKPATNGIGYSQPQACHIVAEACREDPSCRDKLEHFEQSCAVDSVTKKCAGKTTLCRKALIGILGTPLRTSCACQGTDLSQLYDCLGWQRLLWLNPCVVDAQKEYHVQRLTEMGLLITTTTPRVTTTTSTTTTTRAPVIKKTTTTTTTTTTTSSPYTYNRRPPSQQPPPPPPIHKHHPTPTFVDTNTIDKNFDIHYSKGGQHDKDFSEPNQYDVSSHDTYGPDNFGTVAGGGFETETPIVSGIGAGQEGDDNLQAIITSTFLPTTTTVETTTKPPKYCMVQRPHQPDQRIEEGKSRRLYLAEDPECSELCTCSESLTVSCHALCVPLAPCRTALAYYSHAAPAYQAYRGRCLCYSGRFICMRPPPGEYALPNGVFLLLGYSSTDEALLRPHTNLGIQDAVRALQQYVIKHVDNQTSCTLTLYNMTDENIILSVRLPHDSKAKAVSLLKQEKAQCKPVMETVSHHINSQFIELSAHRLLSIFKMAEVQVIMQTINRAAFSIQQSSMSIIIMLFLSICPIVRWLNTGWGFHNYLRDMIPA